MMPAEVSAYVARHLELPELASVTGLKRFTLKYVKVLQNLRRKEPSRPAHLVEQKALLAHSQGAAPQSYLEAALPRRSPNLNWTLTSHSWTALSPRHR